jgi:hypothetical protein
MPEQLMRRPRRRDGPEICEAAGRIPEGFLRSVGERSEEMLEETTRFVHAK